MAEHRHGEMDVSTQQRTFAGFVRAATIVVFVVAAILIFLTTRI